MEANKNMKYLELSAVWAHGHIYHCSLGQTTGMCNTYQLLIQGSLQIQHYHIPLLYSLLIILVDRHQLKRQLIPASLTTHIYFMLFLLALI